jgi:hypothetical protein
MPIGRSDGCLSTVWYQPRCAMVKTRPAQRNTEGGSISRSVPAPPTELRRALRNGFHYAHAECNAHWWIRRLPEEHRMVPAEVCDGQDPARST